MNKLYVILISFIVYAFLFVACGQEYFSELCPENSGSKIIHPICFPNDNEQGENEEKQPVIDPPKDDPETDDPETDDPEVNDPEIDDLKEKDNEFYENAEGTFILTDIPSEFIGKYAIFRAATGCFVSTVVYGFNSVTKDPDAYHLHMVQIQNSTLKIPVWNFRQGGSPERDRIITYSKYLGNHHFGYAGHTGSADSIIEIYDFSLFPISTKDYGFIATPAPLARIKFPRITFSNGSAVISFNDGRVNILAEPIAAP